MNQPSKINLIVKALSIFTFLLFCNLYITSCATNPKFSGTGDLCGLVVDENNKPIKDFVEPDAIYEKGGMRFYLAEGNKHYRRLWDRMVIKRRKED